MRWSTDQGLGTSTAWYEGRFMGELQGEDLFLEGRPSPEKIGGVGLTHLDNL